MSDLIQQALDVAEGAARRAFCTPWYIAKNLPPIGAVGLAGEIAEGLWGAFCQGPFPPAPGSPTTQPPPFSGGQCEGVNYRITYSYEAWTTFTQPSRITPPQSPRLGVGPVRGFRLEQPRTINGVEGFGRIVFLGGAGDATWHQASSNSALRAPMISAIARADGLPDECGDPPGIPGPPVPPPSYPGPLPPETRPVTPDGEQPGGDFIFSPEVGDVYVDVDGSLNIPVNVNVGGPQFGPVNVPVNIKLPDFEPTFSPTIIVGGGGGGPGGTDPQPQPPQKPCCEIPPPRLPRLPTGAEEETEEPDDDEPGERVLGVVVAVAPVGPNRATEIMNDEGGPNIFAPRCGVVQFSIAFPETLAWSVDYPVKSRRQYIPAPPDVRVTGAVFLPDPGFAGEVFPVLAPTKNGKPKPAPTG